MKFLKDPVNIAQDLATKKAIKQLADKFEFVYFGQVDSREDAGELVGGVTPGVRHSDHHYTVGNFRGHDVTIVERLTRLGKGKTPQSQRWLIMQFDIKRTGLPRLFLDAHPRETEVYIALFAGLTHFENLSSLFMAHDPLFYKHFRVFGQPQVFETIQYVLRPELTAMLAHHFHQFDYEFDDDHIFIYAPNTAATPSMLHEMMRVGLWLCEQINALR